MGHCQHELDKRNNRIAGINQETVKFLIYIIHIIENFDSVSRCYHVWCWLNRMTCAKSKTCYSRSSSTSAMVLTLARRLKPASERTGKLNMGCILCIGVSWLSKVTVWEQSSSVSQLRKSDCFNFDTIDSC